LRAAAGGIVREHSADPEKTPGGEKASPGAYQDIGQQLGRLLGKAGSRARPWERLQHCRAT